MGLRHHLHLIVINVRKYLFLDGGSNNFDDTVARATAAKESGVTILVVAVGGWLNMNEVRAIASVPVEQDVFFVSGFDDLISIEMALHDSVCNSEYTSLPLSHGRDPFWFKSRL